MSLALGFAIPFWGMVVCWWVNRYMLGTSMTVSVSWVWWCSYIENEVIIDRVVWLCAVLCWCLCGVHMYHVLGWVSFTIHQHNMHFWNVTIIICGQLRGSNCWELTLLKADEKKADGLKADELWSVGLLQVPDVQLSMESIPTKFIELTVTPPTKTSTKW